MAMRASFWVSLSRYTHCQPTSVAAVQLLYSSSSSFASGSLSLARLGPAASFQERSYSVGQDFCDFHSGAGKYATNSNIGAARSSVKAETASVRGTKLKNVRVRFAPSPTGNLHVGGARTALFNYLFAKSIGGKFILRIEDTDLERSSRESEEAMIRDLQWMGLEWDEGPDVAGVYGPYRQSERTHIYKQFADKLLDSGKVYRCFCSDEELEAMREEAKAKNFPPKYMGKWSKASKEEVDAELSKGTPYTYRFRVPQEGSVTINDLIRGEVSWDKSTIGDFVVLRSNGQPVYNFCVAVDDATMQITHVIRHLSGRENSLIHELQNNSGSQRNCYSEFRANNLFTCRAEEHLPNTLRQVLIYNALGFPTPQFAHCSLILAPDRSKLSKRHGATSVGQFKEMGYLPQAMVNYLALLGWNDGSEEEIFVVDKIIEKFTIERITKSAAIFDIAKLGWMNGQHLRALPLGQLSKMVGENWVKAGILSQSDGPFVMRAVEVLRNSIDSVADSERALLDIFAYPLHTTLASEEAKDVVEDNLAEVAESIIKAYDQGELVAAIENGHESWQNFVKAIGKSLKRKGKRLFLPIRVVLTGRMQGPSLGDGIAILKESESSGIVTAPLVPLGERIQTVKIVDWAEVSQRLGSCMSSAETTPVLLH